MEPYEYKRPNGDRMQIAAACEGTATLTLFEGHDAPASIVVDAADWNGIAEGLAAQLGLPAPVILPKSSARFPENGDSFRFGDFGFKRYHGGVSPSLPGISAAVVPPGFLRELAAHLVALADDAEANPELDEDEINELAEAIHAGTHAEGCTLGPTIEHRAHAVSALRWMNGRRS